ncbi:MAG: hypothetical protein LBI05_10530 [Planctomycetaceae bacterium]|jgi:nicotinic acid mononucleotide adenylyltransferase|nr:hypothetical protein [Planctomycetaceae bacterium]
MTDDYQQQRIEGVRALHQSPVQIVAALSGGGTLMLGDLLTVPGGSRTLLEATVPYSQESVCKYIGRVPEQFCCPRVARTLAMTAFYHARDILVSENLRKQGYIKRDYVSPKSVDISHAPEDISSSDIAASPLFHSTHYIKQMDTAKWETLRHVMGIGCTASLITDRQKKGEHQVHVAVQTLYQTIRFSLHLQKDARTRWEEERLVADLILNAVETARRDMDQHESHPAPQNSSAHLIEGLSNDFLLDEHIPLHLHSGETIHVERAVASPLLIDLFFGKLGAVLWTSDGIQHSIVREDMALSETHFNPCAEFTQAVFPGSFSPIHRGHLEMINIAEDRLRERVVLEISIQNVEKPPFDYIELEHRLQWISQMNPDQAVWLTQTPLFGNKAELFRGTTFVVGADTLRRFADLRFYHENVHELHDLLREIAFCNCRFLVFARRSKTGLESLETLNIPDMLRSLCDGVPPSVFTMDISSSDLRRKETH